MLRVLLVVDDYGELVFLQALLKKMGFDVDGTQNPKKYEDLKLTLNPDLIMASSKGNTINGLKMAEELKRPEGTPRFILIVPHKMAQKVYGLQLKNVDGIIDSPVDAKKLIVTIGKVCNLETDPLIEKYNRMMSRLDADQDGDLQILKSHLSQSDDVEVSSSGMASGSGLGTTSDYCKPTVTSGSTTPNRSFKPSTLTDENRAARMKEALSALPTPTQSEFPKATVHSWNKRIREEESKADLQDLEDERQQFVKALFKPSS